MTRTSGIGRGRLTLVTGDGEPTTLGRVLVGLLEADREPLLPTAVYTAIGVSCEQGILAINGLVALGHVEPEPGFGRRARQFRLTRSGERAGRGLRRLLDSVDAKKPPSRS